MVSRTRVNLALHPPRPRRPRRSRRLNPPRRPGELSGPILLEPGKSHIVNVHALRTGAQASTTELKPILKTSSNIIDIQVLLQGRFVVVACGDSLMVGKRQKQSKTAVQDFEYVWRELKFAQRITTFHTYVRDPAEVTGKPAKSVQDHRDVIDIAIGDISGVLLLFEDILSSFAAIESVQKGGKTKADNAESLRPKRLHWHRDAIGSVKWSLDGKHFQYSCGTTLTQYRQLCYLGRR